MLVVLAIIITITSVAIVSQSSFNKTLVLANTAYDIALTLRSAETFGLGSRVAAATANTGYGVHFEASTPGVFTLFADVSPGPSSSGCHAIADTTRPDARPGNCRYDSGSGERVLDYTLGNGITVSNFCATTGGSAQCKTAVGGAPGGLTSLDIVFARPNPQAFMSTSGSYSASITQACLVVSSPQGGEGDERYVAVLSSGQILANATSCP